MRVYVINLDDYGEGDATGEWFRLPVDEEDIKERLGIKGKQKGYTIRDYVLPFRISMSDHIEKVNEMYRLVSELDGFPIQNELKDIMWKWKLSLRTIVDCKNDIKHYACSDFDELAYKLIEDNYFGELPESLMAFIDYDKLALVFERDERFLLTSHGIFMRAM